MPQPSPLAWIVKPGDGEYMATRYEWQGYMIACHDFGFVLSYRPGGLITPIVTKPTLQEAKDAAKDHQGGVIQEPPRKRRVVIGRNMTVNGRPPLRFNKLDAPKTNGNIIAFPSTAPKVNLRE